MKNKCIEYENRLNAVEQLYESSKEEYKTAWSRISDVNNSKFNFEILWEHRLTTIKRLEREIKIKEEKSIEFRNRFDLSTQKLLEKDNLIRELTLEKDKIESQFNKFKQQFTLDDDDKDKEGKEVQKENAIKKKESWIKKREKEEKSFIEANDYILVCK